MLKFRISVALVCLTLLVIVGLQNSDVIDLQFLVWQKSVSLLALIILTAAAGVVIGFVLGMTTGRKRGTSR